MKPLVLEQAAHCKALETTPKWRKASMYMVLAGLSYCNMGCMQLGIVTLKQGLRTVEDKPWHLIRNELSHKLGNFCRCVPSSSSDFVPELYHCSLVYRKPGIY